MNCSECRGNAAVFVVALGLACLFFAGCAVDQKKEVSMYRTVLDGPKPPAFDYRRGDPLSLEAALLLANRNDEQLASGGETYVQALIAKDLQFAAFLPTLSLQPVTYFINHRPGFSGTASTVTNKGYQRAFTDVPVGASGNVFNGFQDVSNLRKAGYTAEQQQQLLLDLQQTTLINVAQAYYLVVTNERSVFVLLDSLRVQNEMVRNMEGRLVAGLARPLDVAQAQAQAAATAVTLIQAQNNVRTSRIELAFLTGAPVEDAKVDDRITVPTTLPSEDAAVKAAVKTRQDAKAAEGAVEAARQAVQAAIGQYYPSVTLNLDYYFHKEFTTSLWEGIFQYNIPIFMWAIHDNVRTAYSQLRQSWLAEQRVLRLVSQQVRTAQENLEGARLLVAELVVEVKAARIALEEAQASYIAGLSTYLDVLTAQNALLTAQLSLVTERLTYKTNYLLWLRAEGLLARPDSPLPSNPPTTESSDELTTPNANARPGGHPTSRSTTHPTTAP